MALSKILKFLSKGFGSFLLSLGITLFILSFFVASVLSSVDGLKDSLVNELTSDEVLSEVYGVDINQIKELCKTNPEIVECLDLDNLENRFLEENGVNDMVDQVKSYSQYTFSLRVLTFILVVIGAFFIFLGSGFSLLETVKKVSFSGMLTSAFAMIYYKLFPGLLKDALNSPDIQARLQESEVPFSVVEKIMKIIVDWFSLQINEPFKIAVILTIVFAVIYIGVKIYNWKFNKEVKEEKKE
ncbi:hypothetical protein CL617_01610 [archaeon]|nr:hypothetical protein [archaeon]|tara:strand:+ start:1988 stop:2713 length:726 start_codon:yes stop_codon:yes gene_type:complete